MPHPDDRFGDPGDTSREQPVRGESLDRDGAPDPEEPPHPPGPWSVAGGDSSDPPLRERLRARAGLTPRQWMAAVSLLLAAPYPVFVYAVVVASVDVTLVAVVSLAYSVVAMVLHFVL